MQNSSIFSYPHVLVFEDVNPKKIDAKSENCYSYSFKYIKNHIIQKIKNIYLITIINIHLIIDTLKILSTYLIHRIKKLPFFFKSIADSSQPLNDFRKECKEVKEAIRLLKFNIDKLDRFIKSDEKLFQLVNHHFNNYSEYIASDIALNIEKPLSNEANDVIDICTYLKIKRVRLEHFFNERLQFIKRHKEVYDQFAYLILNSNNQPNLKKLG